MCKLMKAVGWAANQGVPLVAVRSADQPAAVRALSAGFVKAGWGIVSWDSARGLRSVDGGEAAVAAACEALEVHPSTVTVHDAVSLRFPEKTLLVIQNAQRYLSTPELAQALLNARDPFAQSNRMVVLLGPSFEIPAELGSNVYIVDDPLPSEEQRSEIAESIAVSAQVELDDPTRTEAVRATRGLDAFSAAQVLSLSAKLGERIDLPELRRQWIETINASPGLSVDVSGKTLEDVAGLANYKGFALSLAKSGRPFDTIVRLEELEKALGGAVGAGGDTSGVSQGILGALLTWMEERNAAGIIAVGPPGSGKSLCSVATGAACGAPTVTLDVGALKGSLVGQSEERTRAALRTLDAFAGRTFWIATCNSIGAIPPELRRRFRFGVWFFDLPDSEEKRALWEMYVARCGVPSELPASDAGWSGAEIRNTCEMAADLRITPREAAQWIVPAAVSSADAIEALRRSAHGKYLSASKPGAYVYPGPLTEPIKPAEPTGHRQMGGFAS